MGFQTRYRSRRDRLTRATIGKSGGQALTVKMLQRYVTRPIYCGVVVEKWTSYKAIKAPFPGLVDIETFNRAN